MTANQWTKLKQTKLPYKNYRVYMNIHGANGEPAVGHVVWDIEQEKLRYPLNLVGMNVLEVRLEPVNLKNVLL